MARPVPVHRQRGLDGADAAAAREGLLVVPALADELRRLVRPDGPAPPTSAELRLEYASLLGWTGGRCWPRGAASPEVAQLVADSLPGDGGQYS